MLRLCSSLIVLAGCASPTLQPDAADAAASNDAPAGEPDAGLVPGTTISVDDSGSWTVTFRDPAWTFGGSVGAAITNRRVTAATDAIGSYHETAFDYAGRQAAIRAYDERPLVAFRDIYPNTSTNTNPFPRISAYPALPHHLAYRDVEFGPHSFTELPPDSPWVFFDDMASAFVLSSADHFMNASAQKSPDGSISSGIDPSIAQLPAGFAHTTILVATRGINRAYDLWGGALTALSGKTLPPSDAAVELEYLGYWTDNGASYYYDYDHSRGYPGTLLAVRDEFRAQNLPLGYVQLDSWWYPKGVAQDWSDRTTGAYTLTAAPAVFPNGLAQFRSMLGLPLVVHSRWIDSSSPYRSRYQMSNDVSIDPQFWSDVAGSLAAAGVVTYEQDWLNQRALPLTNNLTDQDSFLDRMSAAMSAAGLSMQYCMPLPRHYLAGTRYRNLVTMRVSGDHFTPSKWVDFFYGSRLASALNVWPWADVFMSSEEGNLTLATLSGGIVGVGDALGAINATNLRKSVRPDGVIVKPDAPIVPLDRSFIDGALGHDHPVVAATHSEHGNLRASYVFAFAAGTARTATFSPAELGYSGPVFIYNFYQSAGRVSDPTAVYSEDVVNGRAYYVVAPIGPSGIAFLGDPDKYASLGRQRIVEWSDTGEVVARVAFAAGESSVTLHGYSATRPLVSADAGAASTPTWDAATGHFSFQVMPAANSEATIRLHD